MGLRHSPKIVVNHKTIVMFFISNDPYVQRYEQDLIKYMIYESLGMKKLCVSEEFLTNLDLDFQINKPADRPPLDIYLFSLVCVLPVQILGFLKSVQLGYTPDSPSKNGTISRVVQGVSLYDYQKQKPVQNEHKVI